MFISLKKLKCRLAIVLSFAATLYFLEASSAAASLPNTAFSITPLASGKDFKAIGGYEEALEQVSYLVNYLKQPSIYAAAGFSAPKGLCISGPSGVGKKLLAEAIAGQAGAPFIVIHAQDLALDKHLDIQMSTAFEQAKRLAPCVICIDGIDMLANAPNKHALWPKLQHFLEAHCAGSVVIVTTKKSDFFNSSALCSKYLDGQIFLEMPTQSDRQKILQKHLIGKQVARDVSIDTISLITTHFSGQDLVALINNAGFIAMQENRPMLFATHFDKALLQSIEGIEKTNLQDMENKRLTAAHESGHAIVGHLLGRHVYKVSVLPTSNSWGRTIYIPGENHTLTKTEMANHICVCLAGRAAEILMHSPSMGCADDFRKAKLMAKEMIYKEGMGKTLLGKEDEVEQILQDELMRALHILEDNRPAWEKLTETLVLQGQVLRAEFIEGIVNR